MFHRRKTRQRRLGLQMVTQRQFAPQHPVQQIVVGLDRSAASDRRPVTQRLAGIALTGAIGRLFARSGIAIDVLGARIDGIGGIGGPPVLEGHLGPVGGGLGTFGGLGRLAAVGIGVVAGQERISFQLPLDKGLQLQVRQLQQLDRLLELGRDDQPLPLPDFQLLTETGHCASTPGRMARNLLEGILNPARLTASKRRQ